MKLYNENGKAYVAPLLATAALAQAQADIHENLTLYGMILSLAYGG